MGDRKSISTTSSGAKRKRAAPLAFYAVKAGHTPGIYYSWDDAKAQTDSFKNPIFRKFDRFSDADDYMNDKGSTPAAKSGKSKYYGVQVGHKPGVYTEWPDVLRQVTGYKGGKQKKFDSFEEAQAYVDEGKGATPSDAGTPISLKGHLSSTQSAVGTIKAVPKRQKKNDGSALAAVTNGDIEPGTGPLPADAEDGFDRTLKLNRATGSIEFKTESELTAQKWQPTGDYNGPLVIHTDGASKGNGKNGAIAGVGVFFGDGDPRNLAEGLIGDRQTNQRAELTAIARALDIAPIDRSALIYTDSNYSQQSLTKWFQGWERNDWKNSAGKPVENRDLIEPILSRIRERELSNATTEVKWKKGHNGDPGNEAADALANEGVRLARMALIEVKAHIQTVDKPSMEKGHAFAEYGAAEGQASINGILGCSQDGAD